MLWRVGWLVSLINESAAGMGGAARVVMRGPKSLAQSNQPLYVVDGIPINNRSNDDVKGGIYSIQPGAEGISDINPDDIESVSVLSGAAAAALYGSAAAQGAVMIKDKSGGVGKTFGGVFYKYYSFPFSLCFT